MVVEGKGKGETKTPLSKGETKTPSSKGQPPITNYLIKKQADTSKGKPGDIRQERGKNKSY